MADPGFPVGGAPTHWGGTNLRCVHFLAKMYAKMKEIDPVGGGRAGGAPRIRQWDHSCRTAYQKQNGGFYKSFSRYYRKMSQNV